MCVSVFDSLLLKAVSGEDTHDRTDRSILTPWVKFLWESYRQCLDLLRNNSRIERLYQDIAQQGAMQGAPSPLSHLFCFMFFDVKVTCLTVYFCRTQCHFARTIC